MKWLNVGTNMAAIITAIIAVVTLVQVKNQNKFAHRADIVPISKSPGFHADFSDDYEMKGIDLISYDSLDNFIRLIISNIGFGPSRKNHIEWELNYKRLVDTVALGELELISNTIFIEKDQSIFVNNHLIYESSFKKIDFILPINQEKKETIVMLPDGYTKAWLNILAKITDASVSFDDCEKRVALFLKENGTIPLTIKYEDVLRNKFEKQFNVFLFPLYVDLHRSRFGLDIEIEERSKKNRINKTIDYIIIEKGTKAMENVYFNFE